MSQEFMFYKTQSMKIHTHRKVIVLGDTSYMRILKRNNCLMSTKQFKVNLSYRCNKIYCENVIDNPQININFVCSRPINKLRTILVFSSMSLILIYILSRN